MKRFCIFALAAMVFAACATDDTQDLRPMDAPETLTVGFEEDTRIQLNEEQKTVWTENDLVSVFYRSNANQKWQYQGKTGYRIGNLKRVSAGSATETMPRVVVVYPYNENYYINTETYNVEATLPATQHYLKDSYGLDGNIMISQSEYNQFSLKNVCGWLKVQLTGNGEVVKSISLKGNNLEQVAGQIYINSADATATLASEMGAADDGENGAGGNLVFDDTILTEVTLDCGEGVTLGEEATAFYIALPPQTFEKGLTIEVVTTEGKAMGQCTDKQIVIERNSIQPMAALAFEEKIAANQIHYTTSDGVMAWPKNMKAFGAQLMSNSYIEDKGIMTFDAPITLIGERAFRECRSLTSITIPDSVTEIGGYAFSGCKSLTSINIPDSVTSIGHHAFSSCNSLTSVTIGNGVTEIGDYAFYRCTSLTSVTIPDSVTSIGRSAFGDCTSLKEVYGKFATTDNRCLIVNGTLNAFAIGCGATSYTIPNSVTSIGYEAFRNCTSLTSVTIPDSVTSIGERAFQYCTSLTAFYGKFASEDNRCLIVDGTLHSFAPAGIASYTIPNSVKEIGNYAFHSCKSLTSVNIPDSVKEIGHGAFLFCESLTSVNIPDSVTKIGEAAFENCTSLTSVNIPDSVKEISDYAFFGCKSLKTVYCKPTTPPTGGSSMFDNNASGRRIFVPASDDDSIINAYKEADGWSDYTADIEEYDFSAGQ